MPARSPICEEPRNSLSHTIAHSFFQSVRGSLSAEMCRQRPENQPKTAEGKSAGDVGRRKLCAAPASKAHKGWFYAAGPEGPRVQIDHEI